MNESIAYLQDATAITRQPCSEKTCITCFENRGCMYELYLVAPIHDDKELQVEKQRKYRNPAISQQA